MICIVDCGTMYIRQIRRHMTELGRSTRVVKLKELKDCDFSSFSGIIISGAPTFLTEVNQKEYLAPFRFVKKADVPVLGICLGHQVIGLLHGAMIHRGGEVITKENVELLEKDALFDGLGSNSLFHEEHSESISLPKGFLLLAKSGSCDNEAMKHEEKDIYGVQFHPEMSGKPGRIILKNFVKLCGMPK